MTRGCSLGALGRNGSGNAIFYEAGSGRNDAQYFWYCAWATEAAVAADPADALDQLEVVESMELWEALDHNGRAQFAGQLAHARAGDSGHINNFISLNCHGAP